MDDGFKEEFERWRFLAEQEDDAEAQYNLAMMNEDNLDCLNSPN